MLSTLFDPRARDLLVGLGTALDESPADKVTALLAELRYLESGLAADTSEDPALDKEAIERLFAAGLFTLTVPAEYGGLDASQRDYVRVMEQLGRLGPAYPITAVPHSCVSVKSVSQLAAPALREKVLRGIGEQRRLLAFAITEECGSDVATMRCHLNRAADGSFRLNGTKEWITNLARASHVVVTALCPDLSPIPGGSVMVLVPLDAPGVRVGEKWKKLAANGSDTATLQLQDVPIQPEWLLGTPGHGLRHFADLVQQGRLGAAAALTGLARQAVDASRENLNTELLAQLTARLDALSAYITFTAALGDMAHPDYPHAVSFTKSFTGAEAQQVINAVEQAFLNSGLPRPPSLGRARSAAGLFRLLKGPGEVISYQSIAVLSSRWMGVSVAERRLHNGWPAGSPLLSNFLDRLERIAAHPDGRNQSLLLALSDVFAALISHLAARIARCGAGSIDWSEARACEKLRRVDALLDSAVLAKVDEWFGMICRTRASGRLNDFKP